MNQLLAITKNTYLQTIRQPLFGIVVIVTLGGMALAPSLTGWTLDDDNKMLRDIGLSTLLIQGLFLACFAASSVLSTEIEDKSVLTVAAKPISRGKFVFGKYLGVIGALITAHYMAGLAFFMTMRHGVLQTARDTSDPTVLFFGPGLLLFIALVAALCNYAYEWRFLPTWITMAIPGLTLGSAVLLFVDRDWKIKSYTVTQEISKLPAELTDPSVFGGLVDWIPDSGEARLEGHSGKLARSAWRGPMTDAEREFLLGLSPSLEWRRDADFMVQETRKYQGVEILKAALLIVGALLVLAAVAIAAATRLGHIATFLACLMALGVGLSSEPLIKPLVGSSSAWAWAYQLIPNFQCFWMVDALSDDRVIPWSYLPMAGGYGLLYSGAFLALGIALFETREVG